MRKLLWVLLTFAGVCLGQSADDNFVVVGNPAQPVQWTHASSIQIAILRAGVNGTIWIPANYSGTDCNPISSCNPGSALVIDLRGGLFQTTPSISGGNGGGNPATAPLIVNGTSMAGFMPDPFCAFNLGGTLDILCDLSGLLVWNANGFNELIPLTDRPYTWTAAQIFPSVGIAPSVFSGIGSCNATFEGTQRAVTDSTTNTWGATITGGGANHVLAYCDGTNWTVAAK